MSEQLLVREVRTQREEEDEESAKAMFRCGVVLSRWDNAIWGSMMAAGVVFAWGAAFGWL